jgi:hypothetical protein
MSMDLSRAEPAGGSWIGEWGGGVGTSRCLTGSGWTGERGGAG